MRFQPKTEKEIAEAGLYPAGEYDFEVIEAEEKTSSKGNSMVELSVKIFDNEGNGRTVTDYLVDTEKAAFKIRHFAESAGMLSDYENGEINAESMVGRAGKCKVVIAKDKSGQYPDKNAIADYLAPKARTSNGTGNAAPAQTRRRVEEDLDDSIPF